MDGLLKGIYKFCIMIIIPDDSLTLDDEQFEMFPLINFRWKTMSVDKKVAYFVYDNKWKTFLWEPGYASEIRIGGWKFTAFCDAENSMAGTEEYLRANINSFKNNVDIGDVK